VVYVRVYKFTGLFSFGAFCAVNCVRFAPQGLDNLSPRRVANTGHSFPDKSLKCCRLLPACRIPVPRERWRFSCYPTPRAGNLRCAQIFSRMSQLAACPNFGAHTLSCVSNVDNILFHHALGLCKALVPRYEIPAWNCAAYGLAQRDMAGSR
jgi:hypothetical protein